MAKHVLRIGFKIPFFELLLFALIAGMFCSGVLVGRNLSNAVHTTATQATFGGNP